MERAEVLTTRLQNPEVPADVFLDSLRLRGDIGDGALLLDGDRRCLRMVAGESLDVLTRLLVGVALADDDVPEDVRQIRFVDRPMVVSDGVDHLGLDVVDDLTGSANVFVTL